MRTYFALLAGISAVFLASPADALGMAADRPNILFFLSDDHRWDRMGCAGNPFLKTPTMDRLAAEGVRFSNMFVTTSIYKKEQNRKRAEAQARRKAAQQKK
jgi:hypothetical protein